MAVMSNLTDAWVCEIRRESAEASPRPVARRAQGSACGARRALAVRRTRVGRAAGARSGASRRARSAGCSAARPTSAPRPSCCRPPRWRVPEPAGELRQPIRGRSRRTRRRRPGGRGRGPPCPPVDHPGARARRRGSSAGAPEATAGRRLERVPRDRSGRRRGRRRCRSRPGPSRARRRPAPSRTTIRRHRAPRSPTSKACGEAEADSASERRLADPRFRVAGRTDEGRAATGTPAASSAARARTGQSGSWPIASATRPAAARLPRGRARRAAPSAR